MCGCGSFGIFRMQTEESYQFVSARNGTKVSEAGLGAAEMR